MKYVAHDYQEYATEFILSHPSAGLLLDMGLGKTVITLSALWLLALDYFDVGKILVIAPLRVATLAPASGNIKVKAAATKGASTITLTGTTLTGTLVKGDILTIVDKKYVVAADAAVADGDIAVTIYPGLFADVAANAVVTITAAHTANLAFHKNAFALVTRPIALPKGIAEGQKAIVNYDGFGLRVIYDYNSQYKKDVISIDMLCGVKILNPELAVRLLG